MSLQLNTPDFIRRLFEAKQAQAVEEETAEAVELRSLIHSLMEHPGWLRLMADLTPAMEQVYAKLLDGTATEDERAFGRLVRRLKSDPMSLLEQAKAILDDAARIRRP